MNRITFVKSAALQYLGSMASAERPWPSSRYFQTKADQGLFETINRVKNPGSKSPLEMSHAPVITAPATVKADVPFHRRSEYR